MAVKIKICGLSREEDIEYANQVIPDFIGFVFWEHSRRHVSHERAAMLRRSLRPGIQAVGVFVDAPPEEIISLLREGVIDMAQLHGEETEEEIRYLRAAAAKPIMKAVKVRNRRDVEAWLASSADYLLFDSGMGSGVAFDWGLLADVPGEFFLAGGLKPENLRRAMETVRPYAVDLSSGVETDGVKDKGKMQEAVNMARLPACYFKGGTIDRMQERKGEY